jgi:HAD superfamily hydrolase (TIGR01509 family)
MLKAVIFDFDGVITDSEILHFRAFNAILREHGFELGKAEYYKNYLGLCDADCYQTLINEGRLGIDPAQVPDLIARKTKVFEELARSEGRIIEGVREFLTLLGDSNVPMAICSGALRAEIELILDEAKLRHYFVEIVSAEEVKRGKPHPDGFLLAMERLNDHDADPIAPGECVIVEDSHWGLKAGRAAGMRTVAVTNTYDADQLENADRIVTRLDELTLEDLRRLCA